MFVCSLCIECFSSTCGPKSPLNWIYERNHDRSFFSRNTTTSGSINKELSKEEIRKKAAQNILRGDSDDDMPMMTSTHVETGFISTGSTQGSGKGSNGMNGMSAAVLTQKSNQLVKKDSIATSLEINTQLPYIQISTAPEQTGLRPLHGEARIVAPNVSKLSPFSAVEVRLETGNECVAVLCSVDVLKMRSGYFHDILSEQEKNISPANALQGSVLWRDPIIIAEQSPFEAAAFLESLHEGRVLFRGEWNYCWARLRYLLRYTFLLIWKTHN